MRLRPREQYMLAGGIGAVLLFVGFRMIVKPAMDRVHTLHRLIPERQDALGLLRKKVQEYKTLQERLQQMRQRMEGHGDDLGILAFLERAEKDCGITNNVAYVKPASSTSRDGVYEETRVEIKLQSVSLKQIVAFVRRIESRKAPTAIRSLEVGKASEGRPQLDALLQLATVTLNKQVGKDAAQARHRSGAPRSADAPRGGRGRAAP